MKSLRETVAKRIRHYRKDVKRWTQAELADRLGVEQATLQRWEYSTIWPKPEHIDKLCEIFGVTVEEFLKGENEKASETTQALAAVITEKTSQLNDLKEQLEGMGEKIKKLRARVWELEEVVDVDKDPGIERMAKELLDDEEVYEQRVPKKGS